MPLVIIIKFLLLNKEKGKDIVNYVMFLDIGLILVYVSEIWFRKKLMKDD